MVAVARINLLPPGGAVEVVDRLILCVLGWVSLEIIITKQRRAGIGLDSIFLLVHIFDAKDILPLHLVAGQALEMNSCLLRCTIHLI